MFLNSFSLKLTSSLVFLFDFFLKWITPWIHDGLHSTANLHHNFNLKMNFIINNTFMFKRKQKSLYEKDDWNVITHYHNLLTTFTFSSNIKILSHLSLIFINSTLIQHFKYYWSIRFCKIDYVGVEVSVHHFETSVQQLLQFRLKRRFESRKTIVSAVSNRYTRPRYRLRYLQKRVKINIQELISSE